MYVHCVPGDLQLRNLILQTKKAEHKWFELGVSLGVPIEKLERIHDKHSDSPIKALIRVYRYWLSDKNGLMPSWKKLVIALQKIDEYGLSTSVSKHMVSRMMHCCMLLGLLHLSTVAIIHCIGLSQLCRHKPLSIKSNQKYYYKKHNASKAARKFFGQSIHFAKSLTLCDHIQ